MGHTGSVKDLQHSEEGSILFSTGLDRFLRVFEYKKNSEMPHIFLKNKLNCILPIEVEWNPEDDNLEVWESEDDKKSDDMDEEISEDSEIEEEEDKIPKELELNVDKVEKEGNALDNQKNFGKNFSESESEESEEDELDQVKEVTNKKGKKKGLLNKKPKKNEEINKKKNKK